MRFPISQQPGANTAEPAFDLSARKRSDTIYQAGNTMSVPCIGAGWMAVFLSTPGLGHFEEIADGNTHKEIDLPELDALERLMQARLG